MFLRGFLLAAVAACALALAGEASANGNSTVSIHSAQISSEFPDGFRVQISASSDRTVESVAIRLRVGQLNRGAYNYLEFEQRGRDIQGELLWRTDTAANYIPPGTIITYRLEITDDAGEKHESAESEFVYNDPRFEWRELTDGPITVLHHSHAERLARSILATAASTLRTMAPLLGADSEEPIRITVYESWREMRDVIPPRSAAHDARLIIQGQAFNKIGTLLALGGQNALGTTAHEMTHIIVHRAGEGVARKVPLWLHEGLAEYANSATKGSYERALSRGIRSGDLLPVTHMGSLPGDPEEVLLFYGQSKALVYMMIDHFGAERMRELMARHKSGDSMDDALQRVYALDRAGMENRWRDSVAAPRLSAGLSNPPRPTPPPAPALLPYTLTPTAGGQYVGSVSADGGTQPAGRASARAGAGRANTPPARVPLVYLEPVSSQRGVQPDAANQPRDEVGGSCAASGSSGALDVSAAASVLGLAAFFFRRRIVDTL